MASPFAEAMEIAHRVVDERDAAWLKIMALESDLSEARRQLAAVSQVCGDALGTAEEYRTAVGCAEALAGYHAWLSEKPSAVQEEFDSPTELLYRTAVDCLSASERDLAVAVDSWHNAACQYQETREKLAEARKIVWGLIAWARHVEYVLSGNGIQRCRDFHEPHEWWDALPRWLRKEIER